MTREQIFNLLQSLPFFSELSGDSLFALVKVSEHRMYRKGKYLFYQSDPAEFVFYQIDGAVREEKITPTTSYITGHYSFDRWHGLEEVMLRINYFHDVYTSDDSNLLILSKTNLELVKQDYSILNLLTRNLLRNAQLREYNDDRTTPSLKLAKYLAKHFEITKGEPLIITQEQLAEILGYTRETVNKYLKEFESREFINLSRGTISIRNNLKLDDLLNR